MSVEFHAARHRPGQAVAVAVLLAAVSAGLFLLTAPLTALILSFLLVGSLADYFLPCHYQIGSELVVRKGLLRQTYAWSRFGSIHLDRTGVLLSPFRDRHKLENFRGVYLPMDRETARALMPVLWEKLA